MNKFVSLDKRSKKGSERVLFQVSVHMGRVKSRNKECTERKGLQPEEG